MGARTINESIAEGLTKIQEANIQIIWQTGPRYISTLQERFSDVGNHGIRIVDFISRMDLAFAVADLVISRAGAGTISEICLVGKPAILVPSPNVAEDHQTKNALALVINNAGSYD